MPRAEAPPPDAGRQPRRGRCCCSGCLGLTVILSIAFMAAYLSTGHYQPKISSPPPVPSPNALDDYAAASTLFNLNGGDKPMYDTKGQRSLLNESSVVQANQPALARLREGLTKQCGIPYSASPSPAFETVQDMRSLARLLSAESEVFEAGGNHHRAASSALDAIQLGTDIAHGGIILHALTGAAIQSIGQAPLLACYEKLNAKECGQVAQRLQEIIRRRVPARSIIENEHRWLLTSLSQADGGDVLNDSPQGDADSGSGQQGKRTMSRLAWHFYRDSTLRNLEHYMAAVEPEYDKPPFQRQAVPIPGGLAGGFAPSFTHFDNSLNRADLRNRLLLVEIAVHKFRLEHRELPVSLDDLKLDPKALIDPDSSKPVIYKRSGRGYLLYGVGPDGKDDGGVPADENANSNGALMGPGDLGVRRFGLPAPNSNSVPASYRTVPHMKLPILPPGSPPLKG